MFIEDAELLQSALDSINLALIAFCSEDLERRKYYGEKVISIENDQDTCRDDIIARIFGAESMVFSRPDRMRLVTAMDRIVGQAKEVIFDLEVYTPIPVIRELGFIWKQLVFKQRKLVK